jgi:hypothetical protein
MSSDANATCKNTPAQKNSTINAENQSELETEMKQNLALFVRIGESVYVANVYAMRFIVGNFANATFVLCKFHFYFIFPTNQVI